ncbi:MAG: GNAT family N-acetyltransferase [Deltaproteobacteria bacterium]|nr:GNAT family N-acetyltransferase [Deltaproteobacteria bacterium]
MQSNRLTFREGTQSDKDNILELYRQAFKGSDISEKDPRLWDYQFQKNPQGKGLIGLALSGGTIVGHYAILPATYLDENGRLIKYGLVIDVMVHPDYRKKGVFVDLGRFCLRTALEQQGIKHAIGFNFTATALRAVLPGHLKVGWRPHIKLYVYVLPLNFAKIIGYRFPKLNPLSGILGSSAALCFNALSKIPRLFPSRFETSFRDLTVSVQDENLDFTQSDIELYSAFTQNRYRLHKTIDFLNWRYNRHPTANYSLVRILDGKGETAAVAVFRISDLKLVKTGVIVDWWSKQGVEFQLFSVLIERLKQRKSDMIVLLDEKESAVSAVRMKLGFVNSKEYYQSIFYSAENQPGDLPKNPRLNFADFDVF